LSFHSKFKNGPQRRLRLPGLGWSRGHHFVVSQERIDTLHPTLWRRRRPERYRQQECFSFPLLWSEENAKRSEECNFKRMRSVTPVSC